MGVLGRGERLRVIAADSGCSILDERYEPTCVVCTVAVLVEPPYRVPKATLAEAHFWPISDSYGVMAKELELAKRLLEAHGADVIHFDASLRRARLDEVNICLLYTSPSPRDRTRSRMPSSA